MNLFCINITKFTASDYSNKFTSDDKRYSIGSVKNASDDTYKVVLKNTPSDGIITYYEPTNGTFTVKVEGQPVNSNTEVSKDKTVTIEQVVPNPGYVIDTVKYNDTVIEKGEGDKYTFKMPDTDATVSVGFTKIKYKVNSTTPTNGTFTVVNEATVGDPVVITPTAYENYVVGEVKYDSTVIPAEDGKYSFTMPAADVTVSVTFNPVTP